MARIDPLTGMNNRRAFDELVSPLWEQGCRLDQHMSLLLLDVEHFKSINDQYGHGFGDKVLVKTLLESCRPACADRTSRCAGAGRSLSFFCRDAVNAERVAEKLRSQIAALKLAASERALTITVSIASAHCVGGSLALKELIATADGCLYRAKAQGRNRICAQQIPAERRAY